MLYGGKVSLASTSDLLDQQTPQFGHAAVHVLAANVLTVSCHRQPLPGTTPTVIDLFEQIGRVPVGRLQREQIT